MTLASRVSSLLFRGNQTLSLETLIDIGYLIGAFRVIDPHGVDTAADADAAISVGMANIRTA
ncbi:hypothetical protein DF196_02450 [Bifidobacterium callitrichidarum]|uniref:Uncharacterized protein n=1 Tax=Bifidobacterium callitrichidarum TaxID=2052941 RepID=A0A2U2NCF0_9BIFI|nr:hypothetical protein DF196_02450 [Bifidobacterium callitrichidarum]